MLVDTSYYRLSAWYSTLCFMKYSITTAIRDITGLEKMSTNWTIFLFGELGDIKLGSKKVILN